jgi:predicted nucleic acid-binding protein
LIYLDASFLVSLYCPDANSVVAVGLLQTAEESLLISALSEVETINAFGLRVFRKEITIQQAEISQRNFDRDLRAGVFQLRPLPEAAFARARKLSRQTTPILGTRTADLLHVAAALELGVAGFFSFDLHQRKMAETAGLKLNPQF